ncbi:MAG: chemotaxis protein CheC [Azospirillum sp.]|nr:chemotaxis protein CheC [Azospirillum sp.]
MIALDPIVQDALTEIFNLGIGQAASVLSSLIEEEVALTVPEFEIVRKNEFLALAKEQWQGLASIVRQEFDGPFSGNALLVFPARESLQLVRALLSNGSTIDTITELERDALLEVGNIILNACLSSIADCLGQEIVNALPVYIEAEPAAIVADCTEDPFGHVILLRIQFSVQKEDVRGHILFVLDMPAIDAFSQAAQRLIENYPS